MARLFNLWSCVREKTRDSFISTADHSHKNLSPILRPGTWFWTAIFIGFAIRIYLIIYTYGTYDVAIWQEHASGIQKYGLLGYYHANPFMNHPPFAGIVISGLLKVAEITGIPFRILLRFPFSLLDAGTAFVLLLTLKKSQYRFVLTICYWLCPLTIIFSAYHGNTDSSVAFFLILCFYLVVKGRATWAGAVLGIGLWFKIPGILTIPAFLFFLRSWRDKLRFLSMAGLIGISTYLPAIFSDAAIVYKNVFAYQGQSFQTISGFPIWGIRIFIQRFLDLHSTQWRLTLSKPILFYAENNAWLCIATIVFYSLLRRSKKTAIELGKTIAGIYTILYGFSSYWSFQYFAWSIPFWFFAGAIFSIPSITLASIYIYGLYWWVCGNPWLLGTWDFNGHPYWPESLRNIRDLTVLFFLGSSLVFLFCGIKTQLSELFFWIQERQTKCDANS
jgi:Gpi18-like mannosyltransferase